LSRLTVSNSPVTHTVTFDDPAATTANITIYVSDSTPTGTPPGIPDSSRNIDLSTLGEANLTFYLDLGSGSKAASGILSVGGLGEGSDYSCSGATLTIHNTFLQGLTPGGMVSLSVTFDDPAYTTEIITIFVAEVEDPGE
ncbi:MAG: hypothetical protein FWE76_07290, partial [Symbiobacteriaceae bacterium]|nr:hypothetical protein [Symbiobacteriaceae bacterium]